MYFFTKKRNKLKLKIEKKHIFLMNIKYEVVFFTYHLKIITVYAYKLFKHI